MSIRTANLEVSLQALTIQRIEHPQANPLRIACTLRAGETFPSGLTVTAEIHTSRNVAAETAPLASSTVTVPADATSFEVLFDSPQTNQTVAPESVRACWLVLYGVDDADQVHVLSAVDLLLGWHAVSRLTADPPATSILIEKGGVAWATNRDYASGTQVTVGTTAYIATSAHTSGSTTQPGTGASWNTVWAVLSGGGGGTVNLTPTRTATTVVVTPSGGGSAATLVSADGTNAGVMTSAFWTKLNDLPTNTSLTATLASKVDSSSLGALAFLDTVGSSRIDAGAVGTLQLAATAVTTAKITDGAVTVAKTSGFGTIATQAASAVTITGGSITGITDLAIADGGTGASTAGQALTNLGAYPASNPSGFTSNTGTVTAVSVVTANGVSGTSSGGATPALTLTLGAITPSSVNGITLTNGGSGALTVTGTASVAGTTSGTNTGDQTITLTGDVTGSGTGSFAATIAANAVTYAKMQAVGAAARLLGRGSAGTTAVREISLGSGLSMSGDVLSATATGGGTNTIIQSFPQDATFPTTNFATRDTRNNHPVLDFDASTAETAYFKAFIPQGASFAVSGTALTFVIESTATSATSGNVGWGISLERLVANGIDIDADAFGTEQTGSAAVNATSGKSSETTITFTLAQLPSGIAAGDMIRICLKRNTAVSGNHSGDAEFLGLYANMTPVIP